MSILNKLAKYRQASTHEFAAKVPMSPEQAKALNLKLREENRVNVHANRKDIDLPYRVQLQVRGSWAGRPDGYFKNVEVAALAGTLVSIARFGDTALVGTFDESAVTNPEFTDWLAHPSNAKIKKATADLFDTGEF
tara:strand:- start:87 stop:494 length:408 start_codon:yes stop_codon:yes gene_type:complete